MALRMGSMMLWPIWVSGMLGIGCVSGEAKVVAASEAEQTLKDPVIAEGECPCAKGVDGQCGCGMHGDDGCRCSNDGDGKCDCGKHDEGACPCTKNIDGRCGCGKHGDVEGAQPGAAGG